MQIPGINLIIYEKTMNPALISVLIPTYSRPKLLQRAVESVLNQSFKNLVLIVHDNGSDEETYEYMHSIIKTDSRVIYKRHEVNIGALKNFQSLIDRVEGEYYTIISDDDFMLPGHLENAMEAFSDSPQALLYCSSTVIVNTVQKKIKIQNQLWESGLYLPSVRTISKVIDEHFTSTSTIFKRDVIGIAGGFHLLGRDDIFSVLLAGAYPFYFNQNPEVVFTINEARGRWSSVEYMDRNSILKCGAIDREFVIKNVTNSNISILLEYLESKYNLFLQKKILHEIKLGKKRWGVYLKINSLLLIAFMVEILIPDKFLNYLHRVYVCYFLGQNDVKSFDYYDLGFSDEIGLLLNPNGHGSNNFSINKFYKTICEKINIPKKRCE